MSSNGPAISAWWVLLLLPLGAVAGLVVGNMPVPERAADPFGIARVAEPAPVPKPPAPGEAPPPAETRAKDEPASDQPSNWTSFNAAMEESQRTGKPVLMDFNAEWCPPCQRLKREVFDDWSLGPAVQVAVIPVSIVDRVREEGRNTDEVQDLQRRYSVDAFPTLVVTSARTGRSVQTRGYGGPQATMGWISQAVKSVR